MSTLLDDIHISKSSSQFFPFSHLYIPEFIIETEIPRKPILISRSSKAISFKLPPFNPKILENNPDKKLIKSMALYGKVSESDVNVSLTCTDLKNTGIKYNLGSVLTVRTDYENEKYCFACAA